MIIISGMSGFEHICNNDKTNIELFRCSLKDSPFTDEEVSLIWDFYVSHSFAADTGSPVSLSDYGWKDTVSKTDGFPALEDALASNAGIARFCIIRCKTIKDTLKAMDLSNNYMCIAHPRAVMMQDFGCETDENEITKISFKESRINALFRHIRNALAHNNMFIFDNGMCLLQDKDKSKITASILFPQRSLIDWIYIVDKNRSKY